jgi:hypothetical protein
LHEQEGKEIYFFKLECHDSSYLCIAQNKETREIDLVIARNKLKDVPILNNGEDMTKVVFL